MSFGVDMLPALLGFTAASFLNKTPERATMTSPSIQLPEPTVPPRAPLNPSQTAATMRAKLANPATGNNDIVLTSASKRKEDAAVSRTALLGG